MSDIEVKSPKPINPIISPTNYRPDYYLASWEFMRMGRVHEIAFQKLKSYENQLKTKKSEGKAFDQIESLVKVAQIDTDYYQYCANYWMSELIKLYDAHENSTAPMNIKLRKHMHLSEDKNLNQYVKKWDEEFNALDNIQALLALQYDKNELGVEPTALTYDVYSSLYSYQDKKSKLTTKIVSPPLTSRVRFTYKDSPDEAIAHSYVLYWRYDKNETSKIEQEKNNYYKEAGILMPVGIGRTDSQGYLVQSIPFGGDGVSQYMKVENGQFTMHGGAERKESVSEDFLKPMMAKYKDVSDYKEMVQNLNVTSTPFEEIFETINQRMPKYSPHVYARRQYDVALNARYSSEPNLTKFDLSQNEMVSLKENMPLQHKRLRLVSSNHLFNYYSSGSQDIWGFLVYPPDGGLFQTKDLAALGNQGEYAYKGPINPPDKQGEPIPLHCTLQEWERRLKVETDELSSTVKKFQACSASHVDYKAALGRMDSLLNLYNEYPYEYEDQSSVIVKKRNELKAEVNTLSDAISKIIQNPSPEKDQNMYEAKQLMDASCKKVIALLQKEEFSQELQQHQTALAEQRDEVCGYLDYDESWMSVYATISDALALLSMTEHADEAFDTLISPVLDTFVTSDIATDLLNDGLSGMVEDMTRDNGDEIPINEQGDTITETVEALVGVIKDKYINAEKLKPKSESVLDTIFNSPTYAATQARRDELNQWVNNLPGPPSILMVIIENYSSYLLRQSVKNGYVNGYHIRIVMMAMNCFGGLSSKDATTSSGILSVLRSSSKAREQAKLTALKAKLLKEKNKLAERSEMIKTVEAKIGDKYSVKLDQNQRLDRLYTWYHEALAEVKNTQAIIDHKVAKELERNGKDASAFVDRRKTLNTSNVDEFYNRADGRTARVYKSTLTLLSFASLVEDIRRVSALNSDPSIPKIDQDIVMAHWAKTITDSASATASAIVLVNKWLVTERNLFAGQSFLNLIEADKLTRFADRAAIFGNLITLYITSRELYENFNNRTLYEKTDSVLEIISSAATTIGYLVLSDGVKSLLSRFVLTAWIPGIGQALMVIGVIAFFVEFGFEQFIAWKGREFRRKGAVGYYFWQEFESIREKSQRYSTETGDDASGQPDPNSIEVKSFKKLYRIYDDDNEPLSKAQGEDNWGHLSWRAAVPFLVSWRNQGMNANELLEIIEHLVKVPNLTVKSEATSNGLPGSRDIFTLLSPEAVVKFYLHMEKALSAQPATELAFNYTPKKLTYRAVINQLQKGVYIPNGETDELLEHLDGIYILLPTGDPKFKQQNTIKPIIWDHEHFTSAVKK